MPRINSMSGGFTGYTSITAPTKDEPEYLGSKMVFAQAAAPRGWSKDTTYNEYTLRVVNSSFEFTTGGSVDFSTVFSPSITTFSPVDGDWPYSLDTHTTSISEMEQHRHTTTTFSSFSGKTNTPSSAPYNPAAVNGALTAYPNTSVLSAGTGGGHTHSGAVTSWIFNDTASFSIKYLDVIIARY